MENLNAAAFRHGNAPMHRRAQPVIAANDPKPAPGRRDFRIAIGFLNKPQRPIGQCAGSWVSAMIEIEKDMRCVIAQHISRAISLSGGDSAHGGGEIIPG